MTRVLGVLAEAKDRGLVTAVKPIIDALGDAGFWLGEPLRRAILESVREQ